MPLDINLTPGPGGSFSGTIGPSSGGGGVGSDLLGFFIAVAALIGVCGLPYALFCGIVSIFTDSPSLGLGQTVSALGSVFYVAPAVWYFRRWQRKARENARCTDMVPAVLWSIAWVCVLAFAVGGAAAGMLAAAHWPFWMIFGEDKGGTWISPVGLWVVGVAGYLFAAGIAVMRIVYAVRYQNAQTPQWTPPWMAGQSGQQVNGD